MLAGFGSPPRGFQLLALLQHAARSDLHRASSIGKFAIR
jgi:hypothetical protein